VPGAFVQERYGDNYIAKHEITGYPHLWNEEIPQVATTRGYIFPRDLNISTPLAPDHPKRDPAMRLWLLKPGEEQAPPGPKEKEKEPAPLPGWSSENLHSAEKINALIHAYGAETMDSGLFCNPCQEYLPPRMRIDPSVYNTTSTTNASPGIHPVYNTTYQRTLQTRPTQPKRKRES
jgi:hypothetical protein